MKLQVSIYFMWEWWEKYFTKNYPPVLIGNDDELDKIYLNRKRFLFENFGQFGIGEENPKMDGKFVNMVAKFGIDLIPYLYGAKLKPQETGGWMSKPFSKEDLITFKPIDIANHPFTEWLIKDRDKRIKRYGSAGQFLDYEGPTNIAVRLRGQDFYMDLIDDPAFVNHLMDISNESIFNIFKFIKNNFEGDHSFSLGNCNVTLISPRQYEEHIKPHDISYALKAAEISGKKNDLMLHHCDVKIDDFVDVYKDIPNLKALQASHLSDIAMVKKKAPHAEFLAMFSPMDMSQRTLVQLEEDIDRAIRLGSAELDLWNMDPNTSPEKFASMLKMVEQSCKKYGVEYEFNVTPFCWDEIEWAFPKYQNDKFNLDI